MAMTYNTPGVYVKEIPTLAPSVAQVATAIPVFIGYTQQGQKQVPTRIDTLLEYESTFGTANPSTFSVATTTDPTSKVTSVGAITRTDSNTNKFLMYYGLSHYFRNGGGSCYIISLGGYSSTPAKSDFDAALKVLEKEDEPTLIVLLDAIALTATDYYDLCVQALAQCKKLGDRFLIADVPGGDTVALRGSAGIVGDDLRYGAAYHPYLQTTLNYQYGEDNVTVTGLETAPTSYQWSSDGKGITVSYTGSGTTTPKVVIAVDTAAKPVSGKADFDTATAGTLSITISATTAPTGADVAAAWSAWKTANPTLAGDFDVLKNGAGGATITAISATDLTAGAASSTSSLLSSLRTTKTALYNQIKTALIDQRVTLPPSPAIAGIYASVDRDRGVWKAPANVAVKSVIGPTAKISDAEQDRLNIDPAGKSINAIRDFTGKGTLVWGARTLAGNDNEWRYVPVRRLFITIEESTRKATAFAVFEPNDATTWLKVKAMIESYLYGLWQQGALAGSKPESAYFVNVGLGKTMTSQNILEGMMIVEIGVAAVRPAEFIILRFSHKMQEA